MDDRRDSDIFAVTTAVASLEQARELARAIIERRLAACVQLDEAVESFYPWQGRLCQEREVRLTIKTVPERLLPLQALFKERHPYEVPQFLAWPVQASGAYVAWVRQELSVPPAEPDPNG